MTRGGLHCEWMVRCDGCGIDVQAGAWYDNMAEAMDVRNRAVRHESWLLTPSGQLICPECAAGDSPGPRAGAALMGPVSPVRS
jgi:hypothetical protein